MSDLCFLSNSQKIVKIGLKEGCALKNKLNEDLFEIRNIVDTVGVFCTDLKDHLTRAAKARDSFQVGLQQNNENVSWEKQRQVQYKTKIDEILLSKYLFIMNCE